LFPFSFYSSLKSLKNFFSIFQKNAEPLAPQNNHAPLPSLATSQRLVGEGKVTTN